MSRIGKTPIPLPDKVKATINGQDVTIEGGSQKLTITARPEVTVRVDEENKCIVVERSNDERVSKAMHGLTRALINNMIIGVTEGFSRELEINGVGWTARVQGQQVALNVGYADTKMVSIPTGVNVEVNQNRIKVTGPNKQLVGQCAAEIRATRKPEPYNGKGVKYVEEVISRKEGKAFAGG